MNSNKQHEAQLVNWKQTTKQTKHIIKTTLNKPINKVKQKRKSSEQYKPWTNLRKKQANHNTNHKQPKQTFKQH